MIKKPVCKCKHLYLVVDIIDLALTLMDGRKYRKAKQILELIIDYSKTVDRKKLNEAIQIWYKEDQKALIRFFRILSKD